MSRFYTEENPKGNLRSYLTYFNVIAVTLICIIIGPMIGNRFTIKRNTIKTLELIWSIYILSRLAVILFSYVNELAFTNLICMDKPYLKDWVDQSFVGSSIAMLLISFSTYTNRFMIFSMIIFNFICLDMPYKWIQYTIFNLSYIFITLTSNRKYQLICSNIRNTSSIVVIIAWAIHNYFYNCSGYWQILLVDALFSIFLQVFFIMWKRRRFKIN